MSDAMRPPFLPSVLPSWIRFDDDDDTSDDYGEITFVGKSVQEQGTSSSSLISTRPKRRKVQSDGAIMKQQEGEVLQEIGNKDSSSAPSPRKKRLSLSLPESSSTSSSTVTVPAAAAAAVEQKPEEVVNLLIGDLAEISASVNNIKKELTRTKKRIQKHGASQFVIDSGLIGKVNENKENMAALQHLVDKSLTIKPIRKRIKLLIGNAVELNQKNVAFYSDAVEVAKFKWKLKATTNEQGDWLGLFLHVTPPIGYWASTYRIDVDYRLSISNTYRHKDVFSEALGHERVFNKNATLKGWPQMARVQDLLNPAQGFLHDGQIEVEADFTIQSSTLDHFV